MEDVWSAINGPDRAYYAGILAVLGLTCLLKAARKYVQGRKEALKARGDAEAEASRRDLEASRARAEEARPQGVGLREKTPALELADEARAWNAWVAGIEVQISLAIQEAQARVVRDGGSVLVTVNEPYEIEVTFSPDGKVVSQSAPAVTVEPLPEGDPRYKKGDGWQTDVVIDDRRYCLHEQAGYAYLPRHMRERHIARCRARLDALKAGSLTREYPTADNAAPGGVPGVPRTASADRAVQKKIDDFKTYDGRLRADADAAFAEEIPKIRADAEKKAREVFLKNPGRRASIEAEATARHVEKSVVEEEFVRLVVETAVREAGESYRRPNHSVLSALTKERIIKGDMFTH